jgi:hypothetical protein
MTASKNIHMIAEVIIFNFITNGDLFGGQNAY